MPIFKVEIVEFGYSTITKYVEAESLEQVQAVDDDEWGDVPDYYVDTEVTSSWSPESELVEDAEFVERLRERGEINDLPGSEKVKTAPAHAVFAPARDVVGSGPCYCAENEHHGGPCMGPACHCHFDR